MFNLDMEFNFPTYYQSLKLYTISLISFAYIYLSDIYHWSKEYILKLFWIGISLFSLLLSIDEMLQIHERVSSSADTLLGSENVEIYQSQFYSRGFNSADWLPFYIPILFLGILLFIFAFKKIYLKYKKSTFLLIAMLFSFVLVFVMEYIGTSSELNMGSTEPWFVIEEFSEMIGISSLLFFVYIQTRKVFRKV